MRLSNYMLAAMMAATAIVAQTVNAHSAEEQPADSEKQMSVPGPQGPLAGSYIDAGLQPTSAIGARACRSCSTPTPPGWGRGCR